MWGSGNAPPQTTMLEFVFNLIAEDVKLHPEYHCDVENAQDKYFVAEAHKPCNDPNCDVAKGRSMYHFKCAGRAVGIYSMSVCECYCSAKHPLKRYHFYTPKTKYHPAWGFPVCPWCYDHCTEKEQD